MLENPRERCTQCASSVYVTDSSRSFAKPASSMHGSSIPTNGHPTTSRYQYSPIGAGTPAPGPTTGPSYQPPWPKILVFPVQPVSLRTVQTARCSVSLCVPSLHRAPLVPFQLCPP